MAFMQTQVGVQQVNDGSTPFARSGKGADVIVSDLNPVYYEQSYRNNGFFASTQSGQTTTVGLATTYVGLVVSNPVGNNKNFVINKVSWGWSVIAAAVDTIGIAVGFNSSANVAHTTPATVYSTIFTGGSGTSTAKADTSATLPTAPVYYCFLNNTPTATTNPGGGIIDLQGSLIIPPGGYVSTVTTAASSTAGFWASIQWSELPL